MKLIETEAVSDDEVLAIARANSEAWSETLEILAGGQAEREAGQ